MMRAERTEVPTVLREPRARVFAAVGLVLLAVVDGIVLAQAQGDALAILPVFALGAIAIALSQRSLLGSVSCIAIGSWSLSLVRWLNAQAGWWRRAPSQEVIDAIHAVSFSQLPLVTEVGLVCAAAVLATWILPAHRAVMFVLPLYSALVGLSLGDGSGDLVLVALSMAFAAAVAAGATLRASDKSRVAATISARQQERLMMARELHDLMAHYMTGIALHAQAGQLSLDAKPDVARHCLEEIEESVIAALSSVRSVVGELRSDAGPSASLRDIAELAAPGTPLAPSIDISVDPSLSLVSDTVISALHRIALEAISNTRRHARNARKMTISLRVEGSDVVLEAEDDGIRVDRAPRRGFGLVGVDERVRELDGTVIVGPGSDRGWRLSVRIPFQKPAPDPIVNGSRT